MLLSDGFLVSAGCVSGKEEVQCRLSACIPANQRPYFPDVCFHSNHLDSAPPHDRSRYCCMHSRIHAKRMGLASGS